MNDTAQIQVSVCIITYNQREFIKDCIEGALMQQTNFNFEIVIGDDNSTDGTSEICKCYANRNKNIHYHLRKRNLGMMGNWIATIQNCSGKYIALCEGDDYWNDPFKLQKQVDFLEANNDYSYCFHKTKVIFENNYPEVFVPDLSISGEYPIKDLIRKNFVQTSSVVFRNIIKKFPEGFLNLPMVDWPLFLTLTKYGKIYFLGDTMSVYRNHTSGVWNSKSNSGRTKGREQLYKFALNLFNDPSKQKLVKSARVRNYDLLISELVKENKLKEAIILKALKHPSVTHRFSGWGEIRTHIKTKLKYRFRSYFKTANT